MAVNPNQTIMPTPKAISSAKAPPDLTVPKLFFNDIRCLRGLAIIFVVCAHCCTFFRWNDHPAESELAKDLFDNSTLIFIFIAGFLFQATSDRFNYTKYLRKKVRNVGAPYLVAITPAILYALLRGTHTFDSDALRYLTVPQKIGYMILYGGTTMNYALWFIPVIGVYYLFSPLLISIDRRAYRYGILIALLPLSLLMLRPTYSGEHNLALAIYFLPAFGFGMAWNRFKARTLPLVDEHWLPLLMVTAMFIGGHLLLSNHHGTYKANELFDRPASDHMIDWLFLQKMWLTLTLLGLIRRFPNLMPRILGALGDRSFTIFFYHLYVLFIVSWITHFAPIEVNIVRLVTLVLAALGLPFAMALIAQKAWPSWSKSLVGS